jgi:phosphomannomutase
MKKFASEANFKDAKISKIDGVRADFANGWGILRASNTTPCLVMRFEAKSEKMLKNIKDAFINEIFKIDPALEIPDEAK